MTRGAAEEYITHALQRRADELHVKWWASQLQRGDETVTALGLAPGLGRGVTSLTFSLGPKH